MTAEEKSTGANREAGKKGAVPPHEITSDMVENAHASGDGALKRSEDSVELPPKEGEEAKPGSKMD